MEYLVPRKLIGCNMNFGSAYLDFLNVLPWKAIEKNIKHSFRNQILQEHINSIITGIILPKQLQIQFLKFCFKESLFVKISTKRQIESLQFHDLMLLRKFDVWFGPPNLFRFFSEYFIPERLFSVGKTYFLISPGYLYVLLNKLE